MLFFKRGTSNVVGIDVGSYAVKIVGLKSGAMPRLEFFSVLIIPKEPDTGILADAIVRTLKDHNAARSSVYMVISGEFLNIRRISLPSMPLQEISDALRWQVKERIPFDIDKATVDFKQIQDTQKEGTRKTVEVLFIAAVKEEIEKKIGPFKKMNVRILSVNAPPFALENVVRASEADLSSSIVVIEMGHSMTDISFYRNRTLQFVRTIPIASRDITASLCAPFSSGTERKELSWDDAEEVKKQLGIPYEPMRLEKDITSIQVLTLMRGTLERFAKEVKRSIEYYVSEISGEGVSAVYLAGGGSRLKNIEKYLSEQLGLPVKKMGIPKGMGASGLAISEEESLSIMGAVGVALNTSKKVNLLPVEYRLEKVELAQKISVRLVSIIVGVLLVFSYVAVKLKVDDYGRRVKNAAMHKGVLAKVRALSEKIKEREQLLEVTQEDELDIEYIMRVLSAIIQPATVLHTVRLDAESKTMEIAGVVYEKSGPAESSLTKFMEDMEKSPCLKDAQLTSIQERPSKEGAASSFSISCQLE